MDKNVKQKNTHGIKLQESYTVWEISVKKFEYFYPVIYTYITYIVCKRHYTDL